MPTGVYFRTPAHKASLSKSLLGNTRSLGYKHPPEFGEEISARGSRPVEVRAAISRAMIGKQKTAEHAANISKTHMSNNNGAWNPTGQGIRRGYYFVRIVTGWASHARAVWTQAHGPIPKGVLVHHEDEDSFNDSLDNLRGMTRPQHMRLHRTGV